MQDGLAISSIFGILVRRCSRSFGPAPARRERSAPRLDDEQRRRAVV